MAEDKEQDLSMEDILSSIKNILSEDEQGKEVPAATPQPEPVAETAAVSPEPEEEILELSPAMRITDDNADTGINLDAELDGLPSDGSVFPLQEDSENTETPEVPELPVVETANESESFAAEEVISSDEPEMQEEGEPLSPSLESAELESVEEVYDDNSDPFYEEPEVEHHPQAFMDASEVAEPEPAFETSPSEEPVAAEVETLPEPEPVAKEQEIVSEPVIEEPAAAEPAAESKGGSAVDVSASIISNFAKMFTREHKKEDVPEVPEESDAEPVTALGNGGKTIEGVVADVIRGIIGKEVSENWRRGADYDAYAREEICRQTNQWLNANLPAIVERTVKQEIERVMAKVGSEQ